MEILVNCIIIFLARIADVSLGTARTILVFRGKKLFSFILAFFEIIIWLIVAKKVLASENLDVFQSISYALGFATGNVVGSLLEGFLAIGYAAVEVVIKKDELKLADILREQGYAVSVINCMGAKEEHYILFMQIKRKDMKNLINDVKTVTPEAFITTRDTNTVINGVFRSRK